MPKPTLSPSKITTYLACPVRYRWTYVDPRGRWYLRAKPTYSFGLTLHKVLESFHAHGAVETVSQVLSSYEENWLDAGFTSSEEMAEAFGEGKEILERYVEQAARQPATASTIYVEKTLRLDLGPFVLVGRLDRVDEHADGTLEIVDYKSGRIEVSTEDVATDLALSCYGLLLRGEYPDRRIRATLVGLRDAQSVSAELADEELDAFRADLIVLGERILHEEYEWLTPRPKRLCAACDFLPLCRRHEEWEEPAP